MSSIKVQSANNALHIATTISKAFASNNILNNWILVVVGAWSSLSRPQINAPTDTNGNTYVKIGETFNSPNSSTVFYYASNIAGGANTVTVTATNSTDLDLIIAEYSNITAIGTSNNTNIGGFSSIYTGAIDVASSGTVLIVGYAYDQTSSHSWTTDDNYYTEAAVPLDILETTTNPDGTTATLADQLIVGPSDVIGAVFNAGTGSNGLHAGIAYFVLDGTVTAPNGPSIRVSATPVEIIYKINAPAHISQSVIEIAYKLRKTGGWQVTES